MSCAARFGILPSPNPELDYADGAPCLPGCVSIDDDILEYWWPRLSAMDSYYHSLKRPARALARWGVTLIPPASLPLFEDIVEHDTPKDCREEILPLLGVIRQARREGAFVIHYGV